MFYVIIEYLKRKKLLPYNNLPHIFVFIYGTKGNFTCYCNDKITLMSSLLGRGWWWCENKIDLDIVQVYYRRYRTTGTRCYLYGCICIDIICMNYRVWLYFIWHAIYSSSIKAKYRLLTDQTDSCLSSLQLLTCRYQWNNCRALAQAPTIEI